jgi:hypothetical protein
MIFLQIGPGHHKNELAVKRGCKLFNIEYTYSESLDSGNRCNPDIIWAPAVWFEPTLFPNSKIMYGPGLYVFPSKTHPSYDLSISYPDVNKYFFNSLSPWVTTLYGEFVERLKIPYAEIPFGVDTNLFINDSSQKDFDCLIYFKNRHTTCLDKAVQTVRSMGLSCMVIRYGAYSESDYISVLKRVKFCIWVGCHESQGFALQECLSMNVPIFVWNATNMRDEHFNDVQTFSNYAQKLTATTVPYWDSRCGRIWNTTKEMKSELSEFISQLNTYSPRSYVLENLSDQVCFGNLLKKFT